MGVLAWRARAGVLLLAGTVAVHQLVYGLAGVRPDEHAHAYLAWLTPALFALVFAGVAEVALRVARVGRRPAAPPPRGRVLWPVLSVLLVAIFAAQETAETLLEHEEGHGHALHELLIGHGLWVVAPIALVVGAVLALALRGAAAAEAWVLAVEPAKPEAPAPVAAPRRAPAAVRAVAGDVLARHLAGRAPPLVVVQLSRPR
jgi:hypothetical protein